MFCCCWKAFNNVFVVVYHKLTTLRWVYFARTAKAKMFHSYVVCKNTVLYSKLTSIYGIWPFIEKATVSFAEYNWFVHLNCTFIMFMAVLSINSTAIITDYMKVVEPPSSGHDENGMMYNGGKSWYRNVLPWSSRKGNIRVRMSSLATFSWEPIGIKHFRFIPI